LDDPGARRQLDQFLQYPAAYSRQALGYAEALGIAPERVARAADTVAAAAHGRTAEPGFAQFLRGAAPVPDGPRRPRPAPLVIRDRTFAWGARTHVMAILNATDDSFAGDGVAGDEAAIRATVQAAIEGGADIIDIGGESTRPGATRVSAEEELQRVLPAIAIAREITQLPLSIDTYKAEVARQALEAGADMVNDVWGATADPAMASTVIAAGCPLVLMHNRPAPPAHNELGGHFEGVEYGDVVAEVHAQLSDLLDAVEAAGIPRERLIADPGIGFGKTPAQNVELLGRLEVFNGLGQPLLLGVSRKSVIGHALGDGAADRAAGTIAANLAGIAQGVDILRVHDVALAVQAARVMDAVLARPTLPDPAPSRPLPAIE
jgi:dihydropteroate synthase